MFKYTPTEYEVAFVRVFEKALSDAFGRDITVQHNVKLLGSSGHEHQIDAMATVLVAGLEIRIIADCKRYSEPVSIDRILALKSRMDDTSSHKGILITTTGFQKGTLTFARSKGIALGIFDPSPMKLKIILNSRGDNVKEIIRNMALHQGIMDALVEAIGELTYSPSSDEEE
jgi:hypothetical protein